MNNKYDWLCIFGMIMMCFGQALVELTLITTNGLVWWAIGWGLFAIAALFKGNK